MARVCPNCRRLTSDDELACARCGAATIDTQTWLDVRHEHVDAVPRSPDEELNISEQRLKIGLGGMLACFTFFIVYLIAYLTMLR